MAITQWKPGTIYIPGALVIPVSVAGATPTAIPNADFEGGDTGWTKGTGWAINANSPFSGVNSAEYVGPGVATIISDTKQGISPGKAITASCMIQQGASADGEANAAVTLNWYTSGDVLISSSTGNVVSTGSAGVWKRSTVSGIAPPTTAKVAIGATSNNNFAALYVDNFQWNYVTGVAATALAFKATQAASGTSGNTEPIWPTIVGNTVVDNEVTWEAVQVDSVTWEASSVLTSGGSEPTWPTEPGSFIADGTIAWEITPLRIEDENCPNTKVVAIAASKVFAGDVDVVRFTATLNARDWTTQDDAGFLPSGLQQESQVGVTAMGVYRGNLAIWSPSTFQIWQVDPDPAAMALLDAMEGIGSNYQQAVQPVTDDLFFLAALGVRTVSIAEGTNNLASGDVGVAIDILVQAEANAVDVEPVASYYPGGGQYWLAFRPVAIGAVLLAGQFLLTSTLYPIEINEGMDMSISLQSGSMSPIPEEAVDFGFSLQSGSMTTILLSDGPRDEAVDFGFALLGGNMSTILLSTGPHDEAVDFGFSLQSGNMSSKLVTADMPDEGLDFAISLISGSMTPV